MSDCSYVPGDVVDAGGQCCTVLNKKYWNGDAYLDLRAPNGTVITVDCRQVSPCAHRPLVAAPPRPTFVAAATPVPPVAPPTPAAAPPPAAAPAPASAFPLRPNGSDAVIATFGDPRPFVNQKEVWEREMLRASPLPIPLRYAYGPEPITRVRAHRLLVEHLAGTFTECLKQGIPPERLKYGGSYVWRAKRGGTELSLHTWGIAVDVEPSENPLGEPWVDDGKRLDPRIIQVFKTRGWCWGGDFHGRADPQHFQWATGV